MRPGRCRKLSDVLKKRRIGSILFSPPLGESNKGSGIAEKGYEGKYGRDGGLRDRCDRPPLA